MWLSSWPSGRLSRFGILTALLVGTLVAWVTRGPVRERAARLVPRFRGVDAVAVSGVGVIVAYLWPLLQSRSAVDAFSVVQRGWDHVSHFDMVRMILGEGQLIPLAPMSDTGAWANDSYPQGMHSTVAMVFELTRWGGRLGGIEDLAAYLQATTLTYAASLTAVVCSLCAVPELRRRPGRAALAVSALLLAWTLSPGGGILHQSGFDNFVMATAGVACLLLLLTGCPRIIVSGPTVAASGALMAVAHNWMLLLPMAGAAVLAAWWPLRRRRFPSGRSGQAGLGVLVTATAIGVLAGVVQVLSARGTGQLLLDGGFPTHNLAGYVAPIVAGLMGALLLRGRGRWARGAAVIVAGLATFAWVASAQMVATGHVGYYGIKLLTAVMLVALTTLVHLAAKAPALQIRGSWPAQRTVGALLVGALLVTSLLPLARQGGAFPSVRVRTEWVAPADAVGVAHTTMLERMLAVPIGNDVAFFLSSRGQDPAIVAQLNLWQLGIRGAWSQRAEACFRAAWDQTGTEGPDRREDLVAMARLLTGCGDAVVVVVPQEKVVHIREALPDVAQRIVGWAAAG